MSSLKIEIPKSHVITTLPMATKSKEDPNATQQNLSSNLDNKSTRDWIPQVPAWLYLVAVIAGVLGAVAPLWFDIPQALVWIRYPSFQPIAGLFCFGISIAIFRFIQLFKWMVSRKEWAALADQYAISRLAIADNGLTPEAIQTLAFKEVCRYMRTTILFPHWLLFLTCFALLVGAIPIFIVHLKTLGRQTDLLPALWIPGTVIIAASFIWLVTICSSAFAAYAIQSWYSESMVLYATRHAAALAELSIDFKLKMPAESSENPSAVPGGKRDWNFPEASSEFETSDIETGDYVDPHESRQESTGGTSHAYGYQTQSRNGHNQTNGPNGNSKSNSSGYDGTDDDDNFKPTS